MNTYRFLYVKRKPVLFLLLTSLLSLPIYAQANRLLGVSAGTGLGLINFVDNAFSPALINGQLHYNELGLDFKSANYLMNFELGYSYGRLPVPFRFNHSARANFDVQRKIIKKENLSGAMGLSLSSLTQFRRIAGNNALNVSLLYESTIGIGPSFNLFYRSKNNDGFQLGIRIPVATLYLDRPYELIDNYAIDGQNRPDIAKSWRFSPIGNIIHLNLRSSYHIYINEGNRLSLVYNWEFNQQKIESINRFAGAHHTFMLRYTKYLMSKDKAND